MIALIPDLCTLTYFWVEQCMHALFECPEDVDEITKNHTIVVSGEYCVVSLFLQKLIIGVIRRFDS